MEILDFVSTLFRKSREDLDDGLGDFTYTIDLVIGDFVDFLFIFTDLGFLFNDLFSTADPDFLLPELVCLEIVSFEGVLGDDVDDTLDWFAEVEGTLSVDILNDFCIDLDKFLLVCFPDWDFDTDLV